MTESSMPPSLPLHVLRLRFRATAREEFHDFPGFVWRGAVGNTVKQMVCITGLQECGDCPVRAGCAYPALFEPAPPANAVNALLDAYPTAPPPFVLAPRHPWRLAADASPEVDLTVVGTATRFTPHLLLALQQRAQHGLGSRRAPLHLETIMQEKGPGSGEWNTITTADAAPTAPAAPTPPAIPQAPAAARITLHTPSRLRIGGRYADPSRFHFAPWFTTLMRRLSQLAVCHAPEQQTTVAFRHLTAAAREIVAEYHALSWHDWRRRSSRQGRSVPMGGITGTMDLRGDALSMLWPWLWAGQWVHVGKGAAMGLGRYTITPVALH